MIDHSAHDESWASYRRTMRHEMRTPVGHILSFAELVLDDLVAHDIAEATATMHAIYAASKQAIRLVDGAFAAPPQAGQDDPDPAFAALTDLMEDIAGRAQQVRAMAAVAASLDLTRDLDRIESAARRLQTLIAEATKSNRA